MPSNKKPGGLPSHRQLNLRLRALGRKLAERLTGTIKKLGAFPDLKGIKRDFFLRILNDQDARKDFERRYRDLLKGHDEIVSTSATREILEGVLEVHKGAPLTKAQVKEMNALANAISNARLPTWIVGYALSVKLMMQHPTDKAKALFADPGKTAREHSLHDRKRKAAALEAGEQVLTDANASAEDIVKAVMGEAYLYTLNEMAQPATAENAQQHMLRANAPEKEKYTALLTREVAKRRAVDYLDVLQASPKPGETQKKARGRSYNPGQASRELSPARASDKELADFLLL